MAAVTVHPTNFGGRPVPVDTTRGRTLTPPAPSAEPDLLPTVWRRPPTDDVITDRLALAHWPLQHMILVCGLAGGVGRTTIAGLLAAVLTEQPHAHLRPPCALLPADPGVRDATPTRWQAHTDDTGQLVTAAGTPVLPTGWTPDPVRREQSAVVVDTATGHPADLPDIDDHDVSLLMVCRPDRASLATLADVLVDLHDQGIVPRRRVVVLVNHGAGTADPGSRTAAKLLAIRSGAVHTLPHHPALGPSGPIPTGTALPRTIRRIVNRVALDLWLTSQPVPAIPDEEPTCPTTP